MRSVLAVQEARAAANAAQARAEKAAAAKQTYKEQAVSLARQLGALQRLRAAELAGPVAQPASGREDTAQVTCLSMRCSDRSAHDLLAL